MEKRIININSSNVNDMDKILSDNKGYIGLFGAIWKKNELLSVLEDAETRADFYGEYKEVEKEPFYWVEEEVVNIKGRTISGAGDVFTTKASSSDAAASLADDVWFHLTPNEKKHRIVSAYKGYGYTLEDAYLNADELCCFIKIDNREYCMKGIIDYNIFRVDSAVDKIFKESRTKENIDNYNEVVGIKKQNVHVLFGEYSETIKYLGCRISFPIDENAFIEDGSICLFDESNIIEINAVPSFF